MTARCDSVANRFLDWFVSLPPPIQNELAAETMLRAPRAVFGGLAAAQSAAADLVRQLKLLDASADCLNQAAVIQLICWILDMRMNDLRIRTDPHQWQRELDDMLAGADEESASVRHLRRRRDRITFKSRQWAKVFASWSELRSNHLTASHFNYWRYVGEPDGLADCDDEVER